MTRGASSTSCRASVLVLVLAVLVALTSLALVFARSVRVEADAAANYAADLRAQAIAHGALEYVRGRLEGSGGKLPDDSDLLREAVPVGEGYFWLLKPDPDNDRAWSFGLIDEAGKINVNTATQDMLAALPGMDAELAAGVIDWRDSDDEALAGGAESQYYLMLTQPYQAKNSRLETVEELLLVKDITPEVLYGEDLNRNGVLDANEDDADISDPPDNRDGRLDRGIGPFVTVYTIEPNTTADGNRRLNVERASRGQLRALLTGVVPDSRLQSVIDQIRAGQPSYNGLFDFYYRSGLESAEFAAIVERITTTPIRNRRGLVNINSAPRQVLRALPGLDDSDAQAIINRRQSGGGFSDIVPLLDILDRDKAIAVGPVVTTKSYFCLADIVAVEGTGRSFKRCQAVFDTRTTPPRVIYYRDLTSLGWPLDAAILDALRAGERLGERAR